MTVVLTRVIQSFVGLAADSKPTASSAGSTFFETDTGKTYVFNGSSWSFLSSSSFELELAKGDITGHSFIHKFGKAPDFDIDGGAFVTVWDGANDALTGTGSSMLYNYSATANISQLSSTAAGDTVDIEIQGLDANYDLITQIVTLNGTSAVDFSSSGTPLIRVFRMKNVGSTDLVGTVFCSIGGAALTAGEPDALNEIRAMITIGHNQTLMAVYTIPNGKTGYMKSFHVSLAGAIKTSVHVFHLEVRSFGQVFQTKHTGSVLAVGSSYIDYSFYIPEVLSAKSDVEIHVNTDTNATAISACFDVILVDN